ncbi:MAG: orotate phosphoribosyltransferase [Candidatus Bathyarchaeota archaeon]|jgi:orotate phosphoribosyltransferase|nr:orotate phosphoribosyltransferase [Candidatus Bathyarchaeota archaeon A05DMB-3]MDH7606627.1 orotate phosphoribosyltransferase [Candidatus Bathyarchaeota archaeon]
MPQETVKAEICRVLNKIGALQFGAFKLTSGKISPYYIDLRVVPSFPDAFQKICNLYTSFVKEEIGAENFERVAGTPMAGMPFATLISYHMKKPFIYIRKGVRLHGRQRRVEGVLAPGDRVLLVDDLITTGLSLRRAAKAVIAEGGVVNDAVVLLDRMEGGGEKLKKSGIRLHALLNISEAANMLYETGAINEEQLKTILKQVKKG